MTPPARRRSSRRHLANVVGALAVAVHDEVADATRDAVGGGGPAEVAAVVAVADLLAGRTVDALRHAVGLTHSGGVRLVDRLVADGIARRGRGEDGRSLAITLTPRGQRLARRAMDARLDVVHGLLGVLDDHEAAELERIADKLVRAVVARRLAARADGRSPSGGWMCRLCDAAACGRPEGSCPVASASGAGGWRAGDE